MKPTISFCLSILLLAFQGCAEDFLNIKRNKSHVVPSKLTDFQAMLDKWDTFNMGSSNRLGVIGGDEYYISANHWNLLSQPMEKNGYVWADDVYEGGAVDDWNTAYHRILLANIALEGLAKISPDPNGRETWEAVKGSALFHRAWNHYQLAQLFCKPYDRGTASRDLGIPLRLQSDVTLKAGRGTVEATYRQIIDDLQLASALLPPTQPIKMRPSKPAAYLLLARIFLLMGNYAEAREYADRCLQLENTLLDFNTLNLNSSALIPFDFGLGNPEVLFFCMMDQMVIVSNSRFHADTVLLDMYLPNDLRRRGYFRDAGNGREVFKGSYTGLPMFFTGLAVDEAYLIKAECDARSGSAADALAGLNHLLKHRTDGTAFNPLEIHDTGELLERIVAERRKELLLRGTRWEDLRRFNTEGQFPTILRRRLGDASYTLEPGTEKWVWPIPDSEVDLGRVQQNER